ncbi:SLC13 family permease [Microbacterium sp. USTB-Y]|uniref:SLC13 family permease n=1 Tax=Microbacterium sp. USTB-Y TaxID=2823692 RepID=UPI0020414A35|nr:SLC13 family permease [Microbacterium sp. USTB-Y]
MTARRARLRPGAVAVVALVILAAAIVATGVLPVADAEALGARTAPVLGFVIAITIVAELARHAAVFDVVAQHLARWGRGRVIALWAAVILLAVVSTIFLSLDTTAVIVTPVVVLLAQGVGVSPLPFALATVWLANTASLLLPVSNLTNLLAAPTIGSDPAAFLALSWAPALAGVLVPVVILTVANRRALFGTYPAPPQAQPADRVLLLASAAVLVALLPLLALVRDVWIPATAAALILVVLFAFRRRRALRLSLVPWQALGLAAALFVIVEAAHVRGLAALLSPLAATGHGPLELLRMAGLGALAANGIDNLPAYLVLEPIASHDPVALMALLIGVNLGPLVTPWASLAILLWHHRITALGLSVPWGRFALWGLGGATATVIAATLALAAVSGTAGS